MPNAAPLMALSDDEIQREAKELLAELHAELNEEQGDGLADGGAGGGVPDGVADDSGERPDAAEEVDAPPEPLELLAAAIEHAEACLSSGDDPDEGLRRLAALAHGGRVQKADWNADLHPRGDDGRFISRGAIKAALKDEGKADALRAKVTNPQEREKLDKVLSGEVHHSLLGSAQEVKGHVTASRDEAKRLTDELGLQIRRGEPNGDTAAALIPHLSTMTGKELSRVRLMLNASFGGKRRVAERRAALVAFARGQIDEAAMRARDWSQAGKGAVFSGARRQAIAKKPTQTTDAEDTGIGEAAKNAAQAEPEVEPPASQQPAPQSAAPAAKPAPLSDAEFAAKVQAVADAHPRGFGNSKVFIHDIYDEFKKDNPTLTEDEFKQRLVEANQSRRLNLETADLLQAFDAGHLSRSETRQRDSRFHFVRAAEREREQSGRYGQAKPDASAGGAGEKGGNNSQNNPPTSVDKPTGVGNTTLVSQPQGGGKVEHTRANEALSREEANPAGLAVDAVEPDGVWVSGLPGSQPKEFFEWGRLHNVIKNGLRKKDIVASLRTVRDAIAPVPADAPARTVPSDGEAMAQAVAANPHDTTARMAHADAVRESGDDHGANVLAAQAAIEAYAPTLRAAKDRVAAARSRVPSSFQVEMGATMSDADRAELRAAEEEMTAASNHHNGLIHALSSARVAKWNAEESAKPKVPAKATPVTISGNTYAVRAELAKIPGAKYNASTKKWTVPAEHADAARKIVAGAPKPAPASDLLKLTDAELADRGLIRTSGPRGPYVRRGTREELNDHL